MKTNKNLKVGDLVTVEDHYSIPRAARNQIAVVVEANYYEYSRHGSTSVILAWLPNFKGRLMFNGDHLTRVSIGEDT